MICLTGAYFGAILENVLTGEQLRKIDEAAQLVAAQGHGAVVLVIERGKVRRLRMEVDLSWDKAPKQVLETQ